MTAIEWLLKLGLIWLSINILIIVIGWYLISILSRRFPEWWRRVMVDEIPADTEFQVVTIKQSLTPKAAFSMKNDANIQKQRLVRAISSRNLLSRQASFENLRDPKPLPPHALNFLRGKFGGDNNPADNKIPGSS
jgi:hypothetical protein